MVDVNLAFYSKNLVRDVSVRVYVPNGFNKDTDNIIYLFHGYMGNKNDWTNLGNAFNFSEKYRVALIMPSLENSWAQNIVGGYNYFDYLAYECLETVLNTFSWGNKNLYIAGLSMGGYAALSIGLKRDIFKGIGTFSGVVDIIEKFNNSTSSVMENNKKSVVKEDSIEYLLKQRKTKYSKIYQYCGTGDHLYKMNVKYQKIFKENSLEYLHSEDSRSHEWSAWTDALEEFIKFIRKEK